MANMFEKSVEAHAAALELEPDYLEALNLRASTFIILGKYDEAGADYSRVLELDRDHIIVDAFTGIAKLLSAKEDTMPGGWSKVVDTLSTLIPAYEEKLSSLPEGSNAHVDQVKSVLLGHLKKMHLVMFAYHDHKTGDTDRAWQHLRSAYHYKMSAVAPYDSRLEQQKTDQVSGVFRRGFWPSNSGSISKKPIFIVGFPRCGSTLLERILDAHAQIVGTGEDSIFSGMLNDIRDAIVEASMTGSHQNVKNAVEKYADIVDTKTQKRWAELQLNSDSGEADIQPQRFVDKMLTNYLNIGFIHMLYPDALILHIAREPMDTVFSAYKHEFPPGSLDYTSEFESLAQMYRGYRDIMDHWDEHLPGRVTHIRYEDIVHDMPGMAKAIVAAAGLDWDENVLNFHKKKHAVNTQSTTQVRKGVYKDSLQSWKRYESKLKPLIKVLGPEYTEHKFKTSLPTYQHSSWVD